MGSTTGWKAAALVVCALLSAPLLFAALVPTGARADDSEIGATGGTASPVWSSDVRMAAETVQAVCFGNFAEYRVDFRFVNDGKARTVKLGFPFSDTVAHDHGTERPVGFQAWRNGRPLAVGTVPARLKGGHAVFGYFLHEAVFPHGATMITVSYLSQQSGTALMRRSGLKPGDVGWGPACWYQYWLHTGSTWKGQIGKAVVRYRLADSFRGTDLELSARDAGNKIVPLTSPHRTTPLPRTYQWQFTAFEPKPARAADYWKQQSRYDITLGFADPRGRPRTPAAWTSSSAAVGFGDQYSPLQDGLLTDAWAEGVPGVGIGQWAQATFPRPTHLRELRVLPGNNSSDSAFTRFARPRTLRAVFSDGSSTVLHLKDAPSLQRFPVDVTTRTVRLVIESVYRGTDYPATCISEVEFGVEPAPGYASFTRLIGDPKATGRLAAWAGPSAPAPVAASTLEKQVVGQDDERYAAGDLLAIGDSRSLKGESAPFKEPSTLMALRATDPAVRLPDQGFVGAPTSVSALSSWTYLVTYASGVDLLVDTRLSRGPRVTLASALRDEARTMDWSSESFTDGRRHPFDIVTIGRQVVGLARAGTLATDCSDCTPNTTSVPGQIFWRSGDTSYHLYARSDVVSTAQLVDVVRTMVDPPPPVGAQAPRSSAWLWWLAAAVVALAAVTALVALGLGRKGTSAAAPGAR